MARTYKIMIRTATITQLASLTLEDGDNLDDAVRIALKTAADEGRLDKVMTRVGLPAVAVAESHGDGSDEETVSLALYDPVGTPLHNRSFVVNPVDGGFVTAAVDPESEGDDAEKNEILIGVFPSEALAQQIGALWRNGHIYL